MRRMSGPWRPTVALLSALATAATLLFIAVTVQRPDLIVLAAPLLGYLAVNLGRPGGGELRVRLRPAATTLLEEQSTTALARASVPDGTDLVTVTFGAGPWVAPAGPGAAVVEPTGATATAQFRLRTRRWSRAPLGTVQVSAWAGQGLFHCAAETDGALVTVLPYRELVTVTDALPVSGGIVGTHRSRRRGEGTDLAGIRPFLPGDRLKRIHWPVSLRTGALHVTATLTDLDAAVMIVIDSSTDVGPGDQPVPVGGTLDTAVHAAASLAEHYLRAGDRVGMLDDGQTMRTVLPAAGRAHLDRIVDALLDVDTAPSRRREATHVARLLGRIAPRAVVMLITPLLERARPELAVEIARAGHSVLVIDTLGEYRPHVRRGTSAELAWRLQLLQHDADIARLADVGIPVVAWRGAGSLNAVLAQLSRAAAAPRIRA
jgi:uncharacterized protein (DUF58 family)